MKYHIFYASNFYCPAQLEMLEELNNRLLHTGQQLFIDYKDNLLHKFELFKEAYDADDSEPESIQLINYSQFDQIVHYVFDQYKMLTTLSFGIQGVQYTYVATKKPTFSTSIARKMFFYMLEKNCTQVICKDAELAAFFKTQCTVPVRLVNKRSVPLKMLDAQRKSDLNLSFLTSSYVFTAQASLLDTIELYEYIRLGSKMPDINLFIHINSPKKEIVEFFDGDELPDNISIISKLEDFERYLLKSVCFFDFSNMNSGPINLDRSPLMPLMNGVPIITCKDSCSAELVLPQYNGMILPSHATAKAVNMVRHMLGNEIVFNYFQHNALDRACHPLHYRTSKLIEIFDSI